MASTADAVVVGGGVVGSSVAFHLCARGVRRVVLCERRFLAAGATGKSGALVRMHYTDEPEARLAFASLPYFHHWSDLVGAGSSGFLNCGMIRTVSAANAEKLRANVEMLRRVGVKTAVVGPDEVRAVAPYWCADDIVAAAYEPESGCADPVATTHGFAARARDLGAEIRPGTEATGVRTAQGRVEGVQTTGGFVAAPVVVIAGGAWALPLLRALGVRLELHPARIQVAVFRRPPEHAAVHPVCIDGINDLWLRPEGPQWGSTLAGISRREALADPDGLHEGIDAAYVGLARERLRRRIPCIAGAPMRGGWAGAITLTADGKPVIDRHSEIEGVWFFTGDSGTSFKTAPAIGRALAEWITDGRPRVADLRPFRAARFAEGAPLAGEHEYGDRDYAHAWTRGVTAG